MRGKLYTRLHYKTLDESKRQPVVFRVTQNIKCSSKSPRTPTSPRKTRTDKLSNNIGLAEKHEAEKQGEKKVYGNGKQDVNYDKNDPAFENSKSKPSNGKIIHYEVDGNHESDKVDGSRKSSQVDKSHKSSQVDGSHKSSLIHGSHKSSQTNGSHKIDQQNNVTKQTADNVIKNGTLLADTVTESNVEKKPDVYEIQKANESHSDEKLKERDVSLQAARQKGEIRFESKSDRKGSMSQTTGSVTSRRSKKSAHLYSSSMSDISFVSGDINISPELQELTERGPVWMKDILRRKNHITHPKSARTKIACQRIVGRFDTDLSIDMKERLYNSAMN